MFPNVRSPQRVEEREAITLNNQGEKIFAILHRPVASDGKVPAVLICPGFAGNKCGKFRLFVTLAKELAKRGIATLRFDYRGAGDSEGDFKDITLEGHVSDTLLCLHFLAEQPGIDASRLALLGRSLGGAIAVLAASSYPSIKSLALWAPVFTSEPWKKLWEMSKTDPSLLIKKDLMKHLPAHLPNKEFLRQFFMLDIEQKLEMIKAIPLLHIHGEQDVVVKIEHAQAYKKAREKIENTAFICLPKSDHDFSEEDEQEIAIRETSEWFSRTLLH